MEDFVKEWLGTPYKKGGRSKEGVDCVGLLAAFLQYRNVSITRFDYPYILMEMRHHVVRVSKPSCGDIILLEGDKEFVTHVGVAIDSNRMIHAVRYAGVVITEIPEKSVRGIYRLK